MIAKPTSMIGLCNTSSSCAASKSAFILATFTSSAKTLTVIGIGKDGHLIYGELSLMIPVLSYDYNDYCSTQSCRKLLLHCLPFPALRQYWPRHVSCTHSLPSGTHSLPLTAYTYKPPFPHPFLIRPLRFHRQPGLRAGCVQRQVQHRRQLLLFRNNLLPVFLELLRSWCVREPASLSCRTLIHCGSWHLCWRYIAPMFPPCSAPTGNSPSYVPTCTTNPTSLGTTWSG